MPTYLFECEPCNKEYEKEGSMKNPPQVFACSSCGRLTTRIFSARVSVFKPYVDIHATGKPVLIDTAKKRDEYCKKHRVTYESNRYSHKLKAKPKPVIDGVTLEDVTAYIQKHGPVKKERINVAEIPTRNIDS